MVESCRCPEGYTGLSCQRCAQGYLGVSVGSGGLDLTLTVYIFYVRQILGVLQWWKVADVRRVIQVCPARDVLKDTYVSLMVVEDSADVSGVTVMDMLQPVIQTLADVL